MLIFSFCLVLKYLRNNYEFTSNLSKWIFNELVKINYSNNKLSKALDKRDFEIIKILIKFNKDINLLSDYLVRYCRSKEKYFDVIELLVKNGTKRSKKFIHCWNDRALGWACTNGYTDVAKLLIENGAYIHSQNNKVLSFACANGRIDIVKLLIESGMNEPYSMQVIEVDPRNLCMAFRVTKVIDFIRIDIPFMQACIHDHIDIVKLLIIEINKPSSFFHVDFNEILKYARSKNNLDLIKIIEIELNRLLSNLI